MRKFFTPALVTFVMIIGILGITNPGFRQPYKLFDDVEGKLTHNYFIFSFYEQHSGYTLTSNGKYRVYRRYIGIALNYIEISPALEEQE